MVRVHRIKVQGLEDQDWGSESRELMTKLRCQVLSVLRKRAGILRGSEVHRGTSRILGCGQIQPGSAWGTWHRERFRVSYKIPPTLIIFTEEPFLIPRSP